MTDELIKQLRAYKKSLKSDTVGKGKNAEKFVQPMTLDGFLEWLENNNK